MARCIADRELFETEYRIVWPDKSLHWVAVRGVFQSDEQGAPTHLLGILLDITVRKRTEEALQRLNEVLDQRVKDRTAELEESETRFHAIFEHVADGLMLRDLKRGRFALANEAALRMLGYTQKELTKLHLEDLHLPEDLPFIRGQITRFLRGETVTGANVRFKRKDGGLVPMDLQPTAMRLGRKDYVLLAIRDISERIRLEAAVLNAAEDERQRIGRELHDGLGQTITGIGYLTQGLHEDLKKNGCDDLAANSGRLVELMGKATREAHDLANGMTSLNLNRHGMAIALQELAANTQEVYRSSCRFMESGSPQIPDENTSRQLFRIAQEAVNNAARHSKGKTIHIRLAHRRDRVTLTVRDTGKGIPETASKRTGMGLRIMQYRADAIGAALKIDSARGKGVTVTCVFRSPGIRNGVIP
jgi:two-component system CheB/CheR fusion protein